MKFFQNGILKVFSILIFISLTLSFVFLIFQFASFAREVYQVRDLKRKIVQLEEENKDLEIEFSKSNSLANLEEYSMGFEKAKEVKYIKVLGSWIAER